MEKCWYTIQTYVGYEHRVKAALQQRSRKSGQDDAFGEVLVPTEQVIELVRGKKRTVKRCLFPGYILVQMDLTNEAWDLVHATPKVVRFIGESDGAPTPLPAETVQEIIQQVEAGMAVPRPKILFASGERVKVVDGPFRDFVGTVETVNPDRSRVRVAISVFGRPTPVELNFLQVEAAA